MSETNTNSEELIEEVEIEVDDANVIPIPIDPTLTHPGEAADAKATGDAIRGMGQNMNINGVTAELDGTFHVYPANIPMSGEQGAQNLGQVVQDLQGRTGDDLLLEAGSEMTISEAVANAVQKAEDELTEAIQEVEGDLSEAVESIEEQIGEIDTSVISDEEIDEMFESWGDSDE